MEKDLLSKIFLFVISCIFFFSGVEHLAAQEISSTLAPSDCLDYFRIGSVSLRGASNEADYRAGSKADFDILLENNNDFPVVDLDIYAQVYRKNPEKAARGNFLVDQFFVGEKISLAPHSQKSVSFSWEIPGTAPEGKYIAGLSLVQNRKINISGLPYDNGGYDGNIDFNVRPNENSREVIFLADQTSVNGVLLERSNFFPVIPAGQDVRISANLVNASNQKLEIAIAKKLYYWSSVEDEHFIQSTKESVELDSDQTKNISEQFEKLPPGVYVYEAIAQTGRLKSILQFRFLVQGKDPSARISFASIGSFPLEKTVKNYFIACFHSISDIEPFDGKIYLALRDEKGGILAKGEHKGLLTPATLAFKKEFIPDQDYSNVFLDAMIYDNKGNLVDQVSLKYDCDELKNQPFGFKISISNSILKIKANDCCDRLAKIPFSIEISSDNGKMVFFEPDAKDGYFSKKINFENNKKYEIVAISGNTRQSAEYFHRKGEWDWPYIVAAIVILGAIGIVIIIKKKRNKDA